MVYQASWKPSAEIARLGSMGAGLLKETFHQFNLLILLQISVYTGLKGPMRLDRTGWKLLVRAQKQEIRDVIF